MTFVYHAVPTPMVGEVIYPLNELARVAPTAYELQRGKYTGREAVLDANIGNGRLFNDTVHCSPLHPYRLFVVRRQLGFNPPPGRAHHDRGIGGLVAGPIDIRGLRLIRWDKPPQTPGQ